MAAIGAKSSSGEDGRHARARVGLHQGLEATDGGGGRAIASSLDAPGGVPHLGERPGGHDEDKRKNTQEGKSDVVVMARDDKERARHGVVGDDDISN